MYIESTSRCTSVSPTRHCPSQGVGADIGTPETPRARSEGRIDANTGADRGTREIHGDINDMPFTSLLSSGKRHIVYTVMRGDRMISLCLGGTERSPMAQVIYKRLVSLQNVLLFTAEGFALYSRRFCSLEQKVLLFTAEGFALYS